MVIDQEHSPFDRVTIDTMVLGARAANIAGIVRVGDPGDANILSVLDCGAAGDRWSRMSTAPRRRAPSRRRAATAAGGAVSPIRRGPAASARSPFADHMAAQDAQVTCVAMIEDLAAIDAIDAIAAVEGIDAFFVGRGDLTAAIGAPSMTSPETHRLVEPIMAAARKAGMPVIMLCPDRADAIKMAALGASAFMVASDHGFLRSAAKQALKEFSPPIG